MTITYDFTGNNGDPLPVGLTAYNGTFEIQNNALANTGSSPGTVLWLAGQESLSDGDFTAFVNCGGNTNSTTTGPYCRGTNVGNLILALLNGSNGLLRLFKREGGSFTALSEYTIPSFSASQTYKVTLNAQGDQLSVSVDDVQVISPTTETFNQTATQAGVRMGDATHTHFIDTLVLPSDTPEPSDTIFIDTDDYTFKKPSGGSSTFNIQGGYTGTPTAIERSVAGGAFTVVDNTPSGGTWSDSVTLTQGQYDIEYRFSNDTSINDTVTNITVPELTAQFYGQSNAGGNMTNNQTYAPSPSGFNACLFGNDYNYKNLSDPINSPINQVDEIAVYASASGNWFTRFVDRWLSEKDTPIAVNVTAVGGKSIQQLSKSSTERVDGLNMYEAMIKQVNQIGGVDEVFYMQGERDSTIGTTLTEYTALLNQLANDVFTDLGVGMFIIPLQNITASGYDGNGVTTGQNAIRQAQLDVAASNPNVRIAPPTTGIDISVGAPNDLGDNDGLHFRTDIDGQALAVLAYDGYTEEVVSSTISGTISNIPAGTYSFKFFNDDTNTLIESKSVTFTDESFSETLSTTVGTNVFYITPKIGGDDNTGAADYGVTV